MNSHQLKFSCLNEYNSNYLIFLPMYILGGLPIMIWKKLASNIGYFSKQLFGKASFTFIGLLRHLT